MRRSSLLLLTLPAILVAARPMDSVKSDALYRDAKAHLSTRAFQLGLDQDHGFAPKNIHSDEQGVDHIRLHQTFKGVRVFDGEAILHMADGSVRDTTDGLVRGLSLNVRPELEPAEALARVHQELAPKGAYATEPTVELVIANIERTGIRGNTLTKPTLVYHIHTELENGADETRHTDHFVDARSGSILDSWDSLHRAAASGTGKSQWYGTVALNTNSTATGFELRDMTRGTAGTFGNNVTTNLNNGTTGNGTVFTDADNAWGDGLQYNGTAGMGANAQTAAVDAHRGLQATWDFFKNVFGRNGIDNTGKATYSRMHYSSQYDNAFWSDSCFCMTYGDGATGGSVGEADLDTAGHEMTHGVCAATAKLVYKGESGGLNEANSDIFGTCVEFYALNGGTGSVISSSAGTGTVKANYQMFENSWGHPGTALRYMYKPSLDGASKDAWSSTLKRLDVHYSSGPANHFFFLLAHGSQVDSLSNNVQSPLANAVTSITGIGNDLAARIWYKALTAYMTSTTTYAGARTATLSACTALGYPSGSSVYTTVNKAWLAVNVK